MIRLAALLAAIAVVFALYQAGVVPLLPAQLLMAALMFLATALLARSAPWRT
ncbi:hypothetical protein [Aeromicrobium sp. Root495]|uniref:hypothetical protein n=1 Tax=Aeromicrobium sp. Root495 TaxID=1736550 RepID=UPI000AB112DA|nr:hypothetical protein [Aeromicrobium sp. Root495]